MHIPFDERVQLDATCWTGADAMIALRIAAEVPIDPESNTVTVAHTENFNNKSLFVHVICTQVRIRGK